MKYIFVFGLLLMPGLPAHAAMYACSYTETACDEQGSHYLCTAFGWGGDYQFCSPQDVSTRRPFGFIKAKDYLNECIKECVNAGGAASTCHHQCW